MIGFFEGVEEVSIFGNLFKTDSVILAGAAGILIGFVLLLIFLCRRILFVARKRGQKPVSVPKPLESLRNLLLESASLLRLSSS